MNNNTLRTEGNRCVGFNISVSERGARRTTRVAVVQEGYRSQKTSAIRNHEDINNIVRLFLDAKQWHKAALFMFGINTGFRISDILSFRVRDLIDLDGKCIDSIAIAEQKTGTVRCVYLNEAVKVSIEYLCKIRNLKPDSYIFEAQGHGRKYLDYFIYDEYGNVSGFMTTNKRYDDCGVERYPAPPQYRVASDWIKNAAKEIGLVGNYSSHCMRKTFTHFMSVDWDNNYNILVAQKCLGHIHQSTTVEHYISEDESVIRERWLSLNLGLEAFKEYIKG